MIQTKHKSQTTVLKFLLLLTLLSFSRCKKDEVQTTPDLKKSELADLPPTLETITTVSSTSYRIENSLPSGYVKDGSRDYTSYIQAAINKYADVTFPAFPIMVNNTGIIIPSNRKVSFLTGGKIIQKPTSATNYNAIRIYKATNVTLNNPVVVGDRYKHLGSTGEWGQGITIYGSSNITINAPIVSNCWGDGIYLGATDKITNRNIIINNANCTYNRRNGISVTSVIGLILEAPYCAYSNGISPYAGIDIEPSYYTDEIQNVTINNARTEYNPGYGIQAGFRSLFGGPNKTIGLKIANHIDKSSKVALKVSATLTRQVGSETVTGPVTITNPFWRKNTLTPIQTNILVKTIKLTITNPTVQDINGINLSDASILSLFTYKTNINREANYSLTF
ncbi:hypothetical protein [Mucilaginibacter aquariorum]|uniref:Right-handed parallel beta-helix repeat-containing protein n=1 Tax=Mucilaginibacter aquariorum TaxID=2967225 RepID=A0ABT1SW36_9SPHI|nr:hypothetical protein [Mucilaginibacter aquariorum]MCQ6956552.1 hypothetical protein [Mucilaginibacter aquariorum]